MGNPLPVISSDRYSIQDRLGEGGTGSVYEAADNRRGHRVALKLLNLEDAESIYRIKREFRTVKPLEHPNLIRLYDLVSSPMESFFTMEVLDGWHFDEYILGRDDSAVLASPNDMKADIKLRVSESLRQLVDALETIHQHDVVHRDIKPSNVIVLRGGRLVLLDFGFAQEISGSELMTVDFAGTPIYMAPEQMDGRAGPASDYYSCGMMLRQIFRSKDGSYSPLTPEGLPELISGLTHPEAENRASSSAIADWLKTARSAESDISVSVGTETNFYGRANELKGLHRALADVGEARQPRIVTVHGASGIGKTELVRQFLSSANVLGYQPIALTSRCHLHEAINFRSLDGIVDEFSRYLVTLRKSELEEVRPSNVDALVRLFPVLGRVEGLVQQRSRGEVDLLELHRLATRSLREFFNRITYRRTLVLCIDDCQWIDRDSLEILQSLLTPPDSPPILLVLNYREEKLGFEKIDENDWEAGELILQLAETTGLQIVDIPLAPLDEDSAAALLTDFFQSGSEELNANQLASAVAACEGNPLFLNRFASERPSSENQKDWWDVSLAGLSENQRHLMDVFSISSRPLDPNVVKVLSRDAGQEIDYLCQKQWLKPRLFRDSECYEVFHDRIRDNVLTGLGDEDHKRLHLELADALSRDASTSAYELVGHYRDGGADAIAAEFALQAAEEASLSLAFDRAANLYRMCWELRGHLNEDWWILSREATALASGGRHLASATVYENVADVITGRTGLQNAALHFKVEAATQFLHGEGARAIAAYKETTQALGLNPNPGGRWRAVLRRLPFLISTPKMTRQSPEPELIDRVQMISSLSRGVSITDYRLYMDIGLFWLQEALSSGDQLEAGYAIGTEATMLSFLGWPFGGASHRLMALCDDWLTEGGIPFDQIRVANWWATIHYNEGRWRDCVHRLVDREPEMVREHPTHRRQLSIVRTWYYTSLAMLGEFQDLQQRLPEVVADATQRKDPAGLAVGGLGPASLARFAAGQINEVEAFVNRLAPLWQKGRFGPHRFDVVTSLVWHRCYIGDFIAAEEVIETAWPLFESSGTLRMNFQGIFLRILRGLVTASMMRSKNQNAERLSRLKKTIKELGRYEASHARAYVHVFQSEVAQHMGNQVKARKLLTAAAAEFLNQGMRIHALATAAQLEHMDSVSDERSRSLADLGSHGVVEPKHMLRLYVPAS